DLAKELLYPVKEIENAPKNLYGRFFWGIFFYVKQRVHFLTLTISLVQLMPLIKEQVLFF
ncbi:hypothetical protein, partial [Sporosarcina ureae]|uniref:hypothetical protein n=1 Tax=Sporosarcina ureae TaxID=1571 RepID=UPI0026F017F0